MKVVFLILPPEEKKKKEKYSLSMSNSKYQDIDGYLLFYTLNVIKDLSYFMEDLDGLGSEIL